MLYTIEDRTLNGLADAVRSKSNNRYIGGFAVPDEEPFHTITVDTSTIEDWGSFNLYQISLNMNFLLGDRKTLTKYVYYTLEYETDNIKAYDVTIYDSTSYFLLREGKLVEDVYSPYDSNISISLNIHRRINNGARSIFTIKMWACDENKDYIGARKFTPLEMIDEINGFNVAVGKKLKYNIDKREINTFTLTAEDLEGVTGI